MDTIPVYILDKNRTISASGDKILVYVNDKLARSIPIFKVSDLISHIDNTIKPNALKLCTKYKIPIHFVNKLGLYYGTYLQPTSKNIFLREAQYTKRLDEKFTINFCKKLILGKYKNQLWLLKKYNKNAILPEPNFENIYDKSSILGIEGSIAQSYWRQFGNLIKNNDFSFRFREKNPPRDPINSLLSYGYTLLVTRIITNILLVGLDPYFGFYHENNYRRPSLALDLMEEFRPVAVDLFVVLLVNKRKIAVSDFENYFGCIFLKKSAKSLFVKEWFKWWFEKKFYIKKFRKEFSLNELSQIQTRKFAKVLVNELNEYSPLDFTGTP